LGLYEHAQLEFFGHRDDHIANFAVDLDKFHEPRADLGRGLAARLAGRVAAGAEPMHIDGPGEKTNANR
jgi:hypothetical protein